MAMIVAILAIVAIVGIAAYAFNILPFGQQGTSSSSVGVNVNVNGTPGNNY